MLTAPHGSRAAHTGLNLVEDQGYAGVIADLADFRQVAVRRDDDACLALDGLEDDGGHRLADGLEVFNGLADVLRNAVAHVLDLLHHRGVGNAVGALAADGDGAHALAVEGADGGDVPAAAGRDAGEL